MERGLREVRNTQETLMELASTRDHKDLVTAEGDPEQYSSYFLTLLYSYAILPVAFSWTLIFQKPFV